MQKYPKSFNYLALRMSPLTRLDSFKLKKIIKTMITPNTPIMTIETFLGKYFMRTKYMPEKMMEEAKPIMIV